MNEEDSQSMIEEATMVIKGSSISRKAKFLKMKERIKTAYKVVFYINIASFCFLTIMNINKIKV